MNTPTLFRELPDPQAAEPAEPPHAGPFAAVALEQSIDRSLDYAVPAGLVASLKVGQRVRVPLGKGNRPAFGYVVSIHPTTAYPRIKRMLNIDDERELVGPELMELARWMSRYYCCPLGGVLETVLPAAVRKKVGLGYSQIVRLAMDREKVQEILEKTRAPKRRSILARLLQLQPDESIDLARLAGESGATVPTVRKLVRLGLITVTPEVDLPGLTADMQPSAGDEPDIALNEDQQKVFDALLPRMSDGGFSVNLLLGVTGSGKTEVYLQCIREVVKQGRRAIVLVPEIALTPQTVRRFTARFTGVAILHSGLTATERHRFWQQISLGHAQVVVGARSAVFAPLPNLGVIVVDEEHEASYKQDTAPRYHGRDVAIKRAQIEGVPVLLGSATPSLETYYRVQARESANDAATQGRGEAGKEGGDCKLQSANCKMQIEGTDAAGSHTPAGRPDSTAPTAPQFEISNLQFAICNPASSLPASPHPHVSAFPSPSLPASPRLRVPASSYSLLHLPRRVRGLQMPHVELVDMKVENKFRRGVHLLSQRLEHLLRTTIDAGHQAILLLNRRGYSNFVYCASCQNAVQCKYCDATMTYHRSAAAHARGATLAEGVHTGQLHCHYCLAVNPLPAKCEHCGKLLSLFGLGTQRVEEEVQRKFPDLRFARVDSDSMHSAKDYESLLGRFSKGEVQVLLGTQMIAKGLDYPNVTLVGVISGDTALALPDFRAAERTFQLITQVAGRAGRGDAAGRVVLQTFLPDDPTIQAAIRQDFVGFAKTELQSRREVGLPPFARMVRIVMRDQDQQKLHKHSEELAAKFTQVINTVCPEVKMKGPMPCAISRIAGYHRSQLVMVAASAAPLQKMLATVRQQGGLARNERIAVDVDPVSLL
ncbi:MAG TPA: primosomal protein N' [Tepidisphaeraceae bacterium]|jgi:primosomal protein N' (replication factor Y)|nr:primosomal protein N' [Tepidisphaeraceae bacterium]